MNNLQRLKFWFGCCHSGLIFSLYSHMKCIVENCLSFRRLLYPRRKRKPKKTNTDGSKKLLSFAKEKV